MGAQRSFGRGRAAGRQLQGHRHRHALRIVSDGGHEQRLTRQPRMGGDFRQVFLVLRGAVEEGPVDRARLEFLDHRLAAAGIARDPGQRDGRIRRDHPGIDQRPQGRDGTGGPAAGVGDAGGAADRVALALRQFGKAIGPVRGDAKGGGGVDQPGLQPGRGRRGGNVFRSRVGQAEDGNLSLGKGGQPRGIVLAQGGVDADQADVGALFQPLADLQAGRADIAVDEHLARHGLPLRFPARCI